MEGDRKDPDAEDPEAVALGIAAVFGESFPLEALVELGVAEEAIGALLDAGRWRELGNGRAGFADDADRGEVQRSMPWARARQRHREVAGWLRSKGGSAAELAGHLRAGGELGAAREAYLRAADEAERHDDHAAAAEALGEALADWPADDRVERVALLERLVRHARLGRDLDRAARAAIDLTLAAPVTDDPARLAEAWRELGSIRELQGQPDLALEARRKALEVCREAGDPLALANEALAVAETLVVRMQLSQGLAEAEEAERAARAAEDPALESKAMSLAGLALAMAGQATEARRRIEAALELALREGSIDAASAAYQRMPYVHAYVADYHGHRKSMLDAIDFCDREAFESDRRSCLACMAWAMFRTGDWKGAARVCREATAKVNDGSQRVIAEAINGLLAVFRGEMKTARRLLDSSDVAARRMGIAPMELITRAALALLDELDGDRAAAARRFSELRMFWEQTEDHVDILVGACRAATFCAAEGDRASLKAWAEVVDRCVSANANPESLGSAAFVAGERALLDGDGGRAADHFLHARECFAQSDLVLELAQCDHRAGVALVAAGRAAAGCDLLRRGHAAAKALGARPLVARIEARIRAAGACVGEERRADAPTRDSRHGLTRRQFEVATYLARGCTNKEIAAELGLSTRTIDMHVAHVFDRLNCRTRAEAARKLVQLGLDED